jgi:hypothetical protein
LSVEFLWSYGCMILGGGIEPILSRFLSFH